MPLAPSSSESIWWHYDLSWHVPKCLYKYTVWSLTLQSKCKLCVHCIRFYAVISVTPSEVLWTSRWSILWSTVKYSEVCFEVHTSPYWDCTALQYGTIYGMGWIFHIEVATYQETNHLKKWVEFPTPSLSGKCQNLTTCGNSTCIQHFFWECIKGNLIKQQIIWSSQYLVPGELLNLPLSVRPFASNNSKSFVRMYMASIQGYPMGDFRNMADK